MAGNKYRHYTVLCFPVIMLAFLRLGEYLISHFFGSRDGLIASRFLALFFLYSYLLLIFIQILFLGKAMADNRRIEAGMGRVFFYGIVAVFSVCVVEIISRRIFPSRPPFEQRFPVHQWRCPKPYTMFSGVPSANGLNSLGYVGAVPALPKPEQEFRIFFLGGSTLVEGSPPIPEIIEELFKKNGYPDVKTYNWGVVSSVSGMELARLVHEITGLSPDLVVMYNGANDMTLPFTWDPRPGYPFNFIAYEYHPLVDKDVRTYPATAMYLYGSNILRLFMRDYFVERFVPLEQVRDECGYLSEAWKRKIADTYVENLVKADNIAQSFGARFMAFYQPMIYFKNRPALCEREKKILAGENFLSEGEYVKEMRLRILDRIEQAKKAHGVNIVDASLLYENDTTGVFTDNVHTTQAAKSLMATAIFRHIAEKITQEAARKKSAASGL